MTLIVGTRTEWFQLQSLWIQIISQQNTKYADPGPWFMRFVRSGKNPQEPNPQHLGY
jgi:hypothetical protein